MIDIITCSTRNTGKEKKIGIENEIKANQNKISAITEEANILRAQLDKLTRKRKDLLSKNDLLRVARDL